MGIFDLPAPLFDLVDGVLAHALPAALRVALYGVLLGTAGLLIYARLSNQPRLRELGDQQASLVQEIVTSEDGGFFETGSLVEKWLRATKDRFLIMLLPALIASAPMLFVMAWLSNRFEAEAIAPGTEVCATPSTTLDVRDFQWRGGTVEWNDKRQCWLLHWPAAGESLTLLRGSNEVTKLPWPAPARAIYAEGGREIFTANAAGYLPGDSWLSSLELDAGARELVPFGPHAMRGWPPVFFLTALAASLWLKIRRGVA